MLTCSMLYATNIPGAIWCFVRELSDQVIPAQ